jgi:hypothetical protein
VLDALYPALLGWLQAGDRILMHQDELSERVSGVIAGFLCWCKVIPELPNAIVAVEQLMKRQMGSAGEIDRRGHPGAHAAAPGSPQPYAHRRPPSPLRHSAPAKETSTRPANRGEAGRRAKAQRRRKRAS